MKWYNPADAVFGWRLVLCTQRQFLYLCYYIVTSNASIAVPLQVARYIINETKEHFQCIVISLKEEFYTRAEALIGITAEVSTAPS